MPLATCYLNTFDSFLQDGRNSARVNFISLLSVLRRRVTPVGSGWPVKEVDLINIMAFAKGPQAQEETAKAECLRRRPGLMLECVARRYQGRIEGYVVLIGHAKNKPPLGAAKSAAAAWRECLCALEANLSAE